MKKDILVLGIETSCDETSVAVVKNGREILSNVILSQIDIHKQFGGVVPEIASRNHLDVISQVIDKALEDINLSLDDIDVIATTYGPGLVGALLVGMSYGKSLSYALNKPLVGVNHIEGHICANYLEHKELEPPFISLVVSGGHTHLILVSDYGKYKILGRTRDDAVGEAYDKVARAIGLSYPGGPKIDNLSNLGDKYAIKFPKPMLEPDSLDFSFSGLKSFVLNFINNCKMKEIDFKNEDIAAGFQNVVVDILSTKAIKACELFNINKLVLAGGVASNSGLRLKMKEECEKKSLELYFPNKILCTDNAAMIASSGYYNFIMGKRDSLNLNASPNLKLEV